MRRLAGHRLVPEDRLVQSLCGRIWRQGTERRKSQETSNEGNGQTQEEMDSAIRQLVSRAVASEEVMDIFSAVGLKKPDISILSDEFLMEVRNLPQKNIVVELLRKLLKMY